MSGPLPERARSVSDGVNPSRVREHADSVHAGMSHVPSQANAPQLAPTAREGMGWASNPIEQYEFLCGFSMPSRAVETWYRKAAS